LQLTDTAINNTAPPPPPHQSADDDGPRFIATHYPNGLITVCVEGLGDEDVDGWPLLSFHTYSGVELGPSMVFAALGDARMTLFAGTFDEHKAVFARWDRLAKRNTRPRKFVKQGVEALAALGPLAPPPFPKVDKAGTRRANKVLREARKRLAKEIEAGGELTLEGCERLAEQADREMLSARKRKRHA
jgi:hypothetical protein